MPAVRRLLVPFPVLTALLIAGCASDPYGDPNYALKRQLREKNEKYEAFMDRQRMRRQAGDERYQAWFDSVME